VSPEVAHLELDYAPLLIVVSVLVVGLAAYIVSIGWAYRDAERRGKEGLLAALLVAIAAWPVGLIVWVFMRPER
jgi:hypothetical protein